jgi:hypothetical protein
MHDMAKDHNARSWWKSVRGALKGALRGTTHDYTTGPIGRSTLLAAVSAVMFRKGAWRTPQV